MDLNESAEEQAFRLEVRAFVRDQLPVEIRDKVLKFQHLEKSDYVTWHRILGARGWGAPTWPKEYGGTGWSGVQRVIFEQECMEAGAPRLLAAVNMIGPILMRYGTPEQQAYFLPKTRDMDIVWCQGYSEPGAGSDLASLRTRAERQGDHYVVNGQKIWTSLSLWADWVFALVRTSSEGKPQEGISFLLIDLNTPGITRRPIRMINGSMEFTEVFFDNVNVPASNLVHEKNKGWSVAKHLLVHERSAQADIGLCKRMLRRLKEVATTCLKRGRPLIEDQRFRDQVVRVEMDLLAHEWTLLRVLSMIANKRDPGPETFVLKLGATAIVQKASELLMECAGPDALPYVAEALHEGWQGDLPNALEIHTLAANYFDWRRISIYGGTSEVTKGIMSKMILGL